MEIEMMAEKEKS